MDPTPNKKPKYHLQLGLYKSNPEPNLYINRKKNRFVLKKRVQDKLHIKIVPFKQIREEADYWEMIYDWNKFLADQGDIDGQYWLETERFKMELLFMHPDRHECASSPRPSNEELLNFLDKYEYENEDLMRREMRGDFGK